MAKRKQTPNTPGEQIAQQILPHYDLKKPRQVWMARFPYEEMALPVSNFKEKLGDVSDGDWERATDRFEKFLHDIGDKLSTQK